MEPLKNFVRQAMYGAPINVLRFGIQFGVQIYLARMLSPTIFGIVALGLSISAILTRFSQWGLPEYLSQESENLTTRLSTLFWMQSGYAVLYIIVLGGIISAARWLKLYSPTVYWVTLVLAGGQVVRLCTDPLKAMFKREYKLVRLNGIMLTAVIFSGAISIMLIENGYNITALVAFYVVREVVIGALVITFAPVYPTFRFDTKTALDVLDFGKSIVLSRLLSVSEERGDDYVFGTVAGPAVLGNYSIAWKISSTFRAVIQPVINQGVAPTFAELREDRAGSRDALEFLLRTQLILAIPFYSIVAVTAPVVTPFVFGPRWAGMIPLLQVLTVAGALYPAIHTLGRVHQSRGTARSFVRTQLLYIPAMLTGIVIGYKLGGPLGATTAVSISGIAGFLIGTHFISDEVGLSLGRVLRPLVIPLGTTIGACLIVQRIIFPNTGPFFAVISSTLFINITFILSILLERNHNLISDMSRFRTALLETE